MDMVLQDTAVNTIVTNDFSVGRQGDVEYGCSNANLDQLAIPSSSAYTVLNVLLIARHA
jgi:hypothetical protein